MSPSTGRATKGAQHRATRSEPSASPGAATTPGCKMHCNSKSTRFQKLHLRGRTLTYVHYFHNEWPQRQLPQRLNCSPPAGTIAFPPHFCNIPPPHPPPHPPIAAPVPRAEPPLYPRSPPGAIAALHPAAPLHALLPAKVTHLMGGGGEIGGKMISALAPEQYFPMET